MGLFHSMKSSSASKSNPSKEGTPESKSKETPPSNQPGEDEPPSGETDKEEETDDEPIGATPPKLPNTPLDKPTPDTNEQKVTPPRPPLHPHHYYPPPYPVMYPGMVPPPPLPPKSPSNGTPTKPETPGKTPSPAKSEENNAPPQPPPQYPPHQAYYQPYPAYPYPPYGTPPEHYYGNRPDLKHPPPMPPYGWLPPPPNYGRGTYWPPQPWQNVPKAIPRSPRQRRINMMKKPPSVKSIKFTKPSEHLSTNKSADDSQTIEDVLREEIQNMGCTCRRTKCLKLYCQCFGAKLMCGPNCRCTECFNTVENEEQRKEAIRAILSRNPSAFDNKFQPDGSPKPQAKETDMAHRIGCKCRKSACMKKYCECYAGNVKCTSSCRCMGCKNLGPNSQPPNAAPRHPPHMAPLMPYFHPPPHGFYQQQQQQQHPHNMPVAPHPHNMAASAAAPVNAPTQQHSEPWEAAQSLTFLKRSTPNSNNKKTPGGFSNLGVSPISNTPMDIMPGLSLSDNNNTDQKKNSTPQGDQDLLTAAIAMTEFCQSPPPSANSAMLSSPEFRRDDFASSKRSIQFEEEDDDDDDEDDRKRSKRKRKKKQDDAE